MEQPDCVLMLRGPGALVGRGLDLLRNNELGLECRALPVKSENGHEIVRVEISKCTEEQAKDLAQLIRDWFEPPNDHRRLTVRFQGKQIYPESEES